MAFLKTVKNPHKPSENYENAYWYIVRIIADWCTNKAEVYLAVHIDSNKTGAPIQSYKVEIDNGVFATVFNKKTILVQKIYEYIKTLGEFSGVIDV